MATKILVAIRFAIVNGEVDKSGLKNIPYIVPVLKGLSRSKIEESGASPKRVAKGQKNNVAFFCRHIHFRRISPTPTPLLTLSQLSKWYALYFLLYFTTNYLQAQTPQQRRANDRFAKTEAAKRGKGPVTVKPKKNTKSPLSATWVGMSDFYGAP